MARKREKRKEISQILKKTLLFIIKIPYFIIKGIINLIKKINEKAEKSRVAKKREGMKSIYEELELIKKIEGDFNDFIKKLYSSESQIGMIIGARGTGKTAVGLKILENAHAKYNRKCYAIGFKEEEMPLWIKVISDVSGIENNSFVLIDEGGVLFSSRESMTNANKILSKLILISRHKNLTIVFISQNSSNLEINVLRQADFLILKQSSLLQKEFERRIVQKIYDGISDYFKKFEDIKGVSYVYSGKFKGFLSNKLPSFWKTSISKSFR